MQEFTMTAFRSLIEKILPHMGDVASRFPVPLLLGSILSAYIIVRVHLDLEPLSLLILALLSSFAWSLAASLFAQAQGLPRFWGILGGLIGSAVIFLLKAYPYTTQISAPFFMFTAFLVLSLAPYGKRRADSASFWLFNHDLWLGAALGVISGLLFFAGIASILATLQYLFDLSIHKYLWADAGAIAVGVVGPIAWLGLIPKRFDVPAIEGPQKEFLSAAIAALVKFLLVPTLLIYALILHVYAAKIALEWNLPRGQLGWMVIGFGTIVAVTALMIFPTRNSGGALNALFWRFWPLALIVPTILLFISVGVRIAQYGFTDKRYLVLMVGAWLGSLALIFSFKAKNRDLRLIPGLLVALLVITSIGPWGIKSLPTHRQAAEFTRLLERAGLARNGRLRVHPDTSITPSKETPERLLSILDYLHHEGRLDLLAPVFKGLENSPFKDQKAISNYTKQKNWYRTGPRILAYLPLNNSLYKAIRSKLPIELPRQRQNLSHVFYADASLPVKLEGIGWITGAFSLNEYHRTKDIKIGPDVITLSFDGKQITVLHGASGEQAIFNIANNKALVKAAKNHRLHQRRGPLLLQRQSGELDVRLVIKNINGKGKPGHIRWSALGIILILPKLPSNTDRPRQ